MMKVVKEHHEYALPSRMSLKTFTKMVIMIVKEASRR